MGEVGSSAESRWRTSCTVEIQKANPKQYETSLKSFCCPRLASRALSSMCFFTVSCTAANITATAFQTDQLSSDIHEIGKDAPTCCYPDLYSKIIVQMQSKWIETYRSAFNLDQILLQCGCASTQGQNLKEVNPQCRNCTYMYKKLKHKDLYCFCSINSTVPVCIMCNMEKVERACYTQGYHNFSNGWNDAICEDLNFERDSSNLKNLFAILEGRELQGTQVTWITFISERHFSSLFL